MMVRLFSPPMLGPRSSAEQLASAVSELDALLRGALDTMVAALLRPQPTPEEAVGALPLQGASGPATAPPNPTAKPTLLPGNIAEVTRPYWQRRPEDEHRVIPVLMSAYSTTMSAAEIQSALNWMRYQRHDMARFLLEWVDQWQQHNYTAKATLDMMTQMLRNFQC